MISRPLSIAILACAGWAAAADAPALGLGRIPESVALGEALDLALPLRLDAGDELSAACVQAEVQLGAQRLPPGSLQVALEQRGNAHGELQLRLRSERVVQEPLVTVKLVLGCGASLSRQFVLLADPRAPLPPQPVSRASIQAGRTPAARPAAPQPAPRRATPAAPPPKPEAAAALPMPALLAVSAQDAAPVAATQGSSAAEAAAAAAELRLAAMDLSLKATRDEAAAEHAAMEQMRQRLARADEQGRMQWLWAAAVAALALLVLRLGWRMRAMQRERQALPAPGAAAAAEAAAPPLPLAVVAAAAPVPSVTPRPHDGAAVAPAAEAERLTGAPAGVDELIDLEQQVEFFLVLGEDAAAVDLLRSQLRGSGGSSPLPYLKLLQIFRGRNDRKAHERLRRRFAERFDAVAPHWENDPEAGPDLLAHAAVSSALQAVWPRPLEAMAALQALLFPEPGAEVFALPAYGDVLTLYGVARELQRQIESAEVDVLLPLTDGAGAAPSIFDTLGAAAERPTAPSELYPVQPATACAGARAR